MRRLRRVRESADEEEVTLHREGQRSAELPEHRVDDGEESAPWLRLGGLGSRILRIRLPETDAGASCLESDRAIGPREGVAMSRRHRPRRGCGSRWRLPPRLEPRL